MSGRTFAIGDIHGDLAALQTLFARLPQLVAGDTMVFLGDYLDRGPDSAGVVKWLRESSPSRRPRRSCSCAAITRTRGYRSSMRAGRSSFCRAATAGSRVVSLVQRSATADDGATSDRGRNARDDGRELLAGGCRRVDEVAQVVLRGRTRDLRPRWDQARRRSLPASRRTSSRSARCCGCATATSSRTTAASSSCSGTRRRARC